MAIQIDGDGIPLASLAPAAQASLKSGRKNLIINGGMQVAQRGTSTTANGGFSVDRFTINRNASIGATASQSTDTPDGFGNSLKVEVTTAAAGDLYIEQRCEAYDFQSLAYGTSNAKQVTISFHVKASIAGTYSYFLYRPDSSRSCVKSFTVTTANTWEKISTVIPADTEGIINNDNGEGFRFSIFLTALTTGTENTAWKALDSQRGVTGQVDMAGTLNSTFYITGVQLELGDTATDFEHRSYGEELALCQRYYQLTRRGTGIAPNATLSYFVVDYGQTMRVAPTLGLTAPFQLNDAGVNTTQSSSHIHVYNSGTDSAFTEMQNFSGLTTYRPTLSRMQGGYITCDAEL